MGMQIIGKGAVLAATILILVGCQSGEFGEYSSFGDSAASVKDLPDVSYYRDDELLAQGNVQFKEKNYGKSYAIYKRAVEVYPKDPAAWLGYAASADMIGRFDNADQGYQRLAQMVPNRPEYLNNRGYSHLLRGDLLVARRYFLKAYEIDPSNEVTANNLELMRNSVSFAKRG
ncbi:tetratricopeptide repeat protein [Roseibium salinum]|uniref:Tetratricopeptide repeat protein n=1 Tax=Roseibium salinum TaxID=1604349 RepID=A0ABT3R8Z7_9HYPH|nr:tetratricopeptide repeat protein [Roseibium sp. DSM 29163]MCX2725642.1 tetratricopeptide repeat protein [Roseibium sp. DSM 29163]MDN3720606.1 tetratricopeptide repeat protein [Roseibium salinum]